LPHRRRPAPRGAGDNAVTLDAPPGATYNPRAVDLSKDELAPFNPADRAYRWKLWVRVVTPDHIFYHIYWRRIAAVLALLAVLAWLALAGAAWAFVKHKRGFKDVSYFDLVFYPVRRDHYRASIGQHYLAQGRVAFEKQNYETGYALLTAGLARVPSDLVARRYVAIVEVRFGRVDRAIRTLADGLPHAGRDLDYHKLLFGLMLEAQEDDKLLALAEKLLPAQPDALLTHQFVALQAAFAHYHRGRSEAAERLVADWNLEKSLEGQILLARCDWDRGLRALAIRRLEGQVPRFPKRDEVYLELVRFHREAGHVAEARRYALLRQFNDPASPGPRIDLLHTYRTSGDTAAEQREQEKFMEEFSRDPQAIMLYAFYAVDTAQPSLVEQAFAVAQRENFPLPAFHLARVQVAVTSGDYAGAAAVADNVLRGNFEGPENVATLLRALRAVALYGLDESARAQSAFNAFIEEARLRSSDALLLARLLSGVRQDAQARRLLERAVQVDARNETVLAELVRLEALAGNRAAVASRLPGLLALRKTAAPTLEAIRAALDQPADAPLREQIDLALAKAKGR